MSALINKLKSQQLEARKQKDKEKSSVFTFLLGEIQRSNVKIETDEQVAALFKSYVKKQREEIEKIINTLIENDIALLDKIEKDFTETTSNLSKIQSNKNKDNEENVINYFKSYLKEKRDSINNKNYNVMDNDILLLNYIEKEYILIGKQVLTEDEIRVLVESYEDKTVKSVMPKLKQYEKEHNVVIDKEFAKSLTVK